MAGLSVAHRIALGQMLDRCPEAVLTKLTRAVGAMPGEKAVELKQMLTEATLDRLRRAHVLGALAPLFRPRPDQVESPCFPTPIFARIWKVVSERDPNLLPALDQADRRRDIVADRLSLAAAAIIRDRPDLIWPEQNAPEREVSLERLARYFDLAGLARRGVASLPAWIGRPHEDQVAELRLLLRDAAAISPDGAERMLDILFANLADASLILRLVVLSSTSAGSEAFLFESELAVFVDRLIAAVEARVDRIAHFKPGSGVDTLPVLKADIAWCAEMLAELDITLQLRATSAWGKKARDARLGVNAKILSLLRSIDKAVETALPTTKVKLSSRLSRKTPQLDVALDAEAVSTARAMLSLLAAVRGAAQIFGCESDRLQLVSSLTEMLATYADQAVEMINGGDVADEGAAIARVETVADFLKLIEADSEARTVRRRAAVAGSGRATSRGSPAAA